MMTVKGNAWVGLLVYATVATRLFGVSQAFANLRISVYNETHEEFINRLLNGYNKYLRPGLEAEKRDDVQIGIYVKSISTVDIKHMQFSLGLILYQWWTDERFHYYPAYNGSMILSYYYENIWTPDTFFSNAKKATVHSVTHDNRYIKVSPRGVVTLAEKISATLSCHMNLYYFPHDSQYCSIYLSSFGYPTDELKLDWHSYGVQVNPDLHLPEFWVEKVNTSRCVHDTVTGNFTCIKAKMTLTRDTGFYVIQTYIPTIIFVMLSWLNFYMDPKAVPARVALGLLTVLAITTKSSSALTQLPKVSYVKAIDVWMSTCLSFVLLAFAEYCLVHYMLNFHEKKDPAPISGPIKVKPAPEGMELAEKEKGAQDRETSFENRKANGWTNDGPHPRSRTVAPVEEQSAGRMIIMSPSRYTVAEPASSTECCSPFRRKRPVSAAIDFWSRLVFPLAFLVFNLFYWIKYPLWL